MLHNIIDTLKNCKIISKTTVIILLLSILFTPQHKLIAQNYPNSANKYTYGTTLSGHLRLPKGNPIGGAYVIIMDKGEKEILGYTQTKSGRGPEAGYWMINGIPPNQEVVIKAMHESFPTNMAVMTHKTANDYKDKVCCLTMAIILPDPIPFAEAGGALGIIGLMGSIAREINTSNQMKKTEQFISDFYKTKNEDQLLDQLDEEDKDWTASRFVDNNRGATLDHQSINSGRKDVNEYLARKQVSPEAMEAAMAGLLGIFFGPMTINQMQAEYYSNVNKRMHKSLNAQKAAKRMSNINYSKTSKTYNDKHTGNKPNRSKNNYKGEHDIYTEIMHTHTEAFWTDRDNYMKSGNKLIYKNMINKGYSPADLDPIWNEGGWDK